MKWGIITLFALALLARLLLLCLTPLTDEPAVIPYYNDELAHFNYVRYLADWGKLPKQTLSVQESLDTGQFEYYQAPLYYLLARSFYALGNTLTPGQEFRWVRLLSILFSLAGITILYKTVRRFCADQGQATGVLLLGAFAGIPLRFGYLVSNDSLFFALSCLYFALILHCLYEGCDGRLFWSGVLVAAAGLWTKASFILLLPLFPLTLLLSSPRSYWKAILGLVLPLIAILPWYLRNYSLYGRLIPIEVGFGAINPLTSENIFSRMIMMAKYFVRSFVFPYDQLWGGAWDKFIYPLEGAVLLLLLILGFRTLRQMNRRVFWMYVAALTLNLAGYVYLNLLYFQAEARYFLPTLPFMLTLLALGAGGLVGEKKNRSVFVIGLWVALPWIGLL